MYQPRADEGRCHVAGTWKFHCSDGWKELFGKTHKVVNRASCKSSAGNETCCQETLLLQENPLLPVLYQDYLFSNLQVEKNHLYCLKNFFNLLFTYILLKSQRGRDKDLVSTGLPPQVSTIARSEPGQSQKAGTQSGSFKRVA